MAVSNNNIIKICSLNCAGVLNKIPIIKDFCNDHDLVFLQETWLTPDNLNLLDSVHTDFCSHSVSAVDLGQPLIGRPYGGLSILWRRGLGMKCHIKLYDDPRLMGLILENNTQKLFILNIYLPYFSNENYDEYLAYVGTISSIIENHDHNDIIVIGDFNADINSVFYNEWHTLQETAGMSFVDCVRLPASSYTHINNGSLARKWLDHCLVTDTVSRCIEDVKIIYDDFLSDHLPLCITLRFDMISNFVESITPSQKIKWDWANDYKCEIFYKAVEDRLYDDPTQLLCNGTACHVSDHKVRLDDMWKNLST